MGDPIGPPEFWAAAIIDFEKNLSRTIWFGASEALSNLTIRQLAHIRIPIGFQTVLDPVDWEGIKSNNGPMRYQIGRSARKNIKIRAARPSDFPEIHRCLVKWQASKSPFKLYFMTDPDIALHPDHRTVWLAEQNGQLQGYLIASPIPKKKGWLLEQWVRKPTAPNGVIEQLVDHAITQLGHDGARYITMGLCPLTPSPELSLSIAERGQFTLGRLATSWFYKSYSLTRFKLKFGFPIHEPIYASFSHLRTLPLSCVDTVLAFMVRPSTM